MGCTHPTLTGHADVYRPFGEQQESLTWTPPESKGFLGERFDVDAGLQYLDARYYDPRFGMFLQPDWFEVTEPGVGTNRYGYAGNDTVNLSDPGGKCLWGLCIGESSVVAVVGAAIASLFAVDAAIDISNGGAVGNSPLGKPVGQVTHNAIQGGATIVGMVTGGDDEGDATRLGIGGNNGPQMDPEPEETTTATVVVTITIAVMDHVLHGDGKYSGGHLSGTGTPGKTEFPPSWGETEIRNAIDQVVQSGRTIGPARNAGSVQMEGVVDGVTVKVIINPISGQVTTAYPIKGPGVITVQTHNQ